MEGLYSTKDRKGKAMTRYDKTYALNRLAEDAYLHLVAVHSGSKRASVR